MHIKKYVEEFLRLAFRTVVEERAWEQVLLSRTRSRARIISRESTAWMPFFFSKFVHVPARLWSFQVFSPSVNFSLNRMIVQLYCLQSVGVRENGVCLPRASHSFLRSLLSSACCREIWLRVQNWVCGPVISPKYFRSPLLLTSRSRDISDEIGVKNCLHGEQELNHSRTLSSVDGLFFVSEGAGVEIRVLSFECLWPYEF